MWLDVNKLSLNIEKASLILVKSPQHSASEAASINIENLSVKQRGYVKFLGVFLDENMSWKYHLFGII